MPVWIVSLIALIAGSVVKALLFVLGYMVFRFLTLLGFSYVIYKGMDTYVFKHYDKIKSWFSGMPDFVLSSLGILKLDVYISIVISAIVLRFSLKLASKITLFGS